MFRASFQHHSTETSRPQILATVIHLLDPYSPPKADRIWGMWGSYYNIPEATFYLLKGEYNSKT